ncbi:LacI family DNA-binding transcriptional regulator [Arthrobacter sp. NPDC055585]
MHRKVTSHDVARAAGVSRATVSYVLNGRSGQSISETTRQRVLSAAATLGYAPSTAARTLRRGQSDLVLMLLPPEPLGRALAMVLDAASDQVERYGLRLIAHRLPASGGAVELVRSLAPAALILTTPLSAEELAALRSLEVPLASLQQEMDDPLGPDLGIGALQVTHLAEAGHTRLGVAVPDSPGYAWRVAVRLAAIEHACARLGLRPPAVERIRLQAPDAAAAVARWTQGPEPVTGACAFDDDYGFALLSGLVSHGLSAPADLAVIGAEDLPLAGLAVPPLTTVSVHARMLGALFTQLAIAPLLGADADADADAHVDSQLGGSRPGSETTAGQPVPPVTLVQRASA